MHVHQFSSQLNSLWKYSKNSWYWHLKNVDNLLSQTVTRRLVPEADFHMKLNLLLRPGQNWKQSVKWQFLHDESCHYTCMDLKTITYSDINVTITLFTYTDNLWKFAFTDKVNCCCWQLQSYLRWSCYQLSPIIHILTDNTDCTLTSLLICKDVNCSFLSLNIHFKSQI